MKKLQVVLSLVIAAMATTACSTTRYVPTDESMSPVAQAKSECEYEAKAATASYGSSYHLVRHHEGGILGQAVGDGVVVGMRQADLIKGCMKAHGYAAVKG